MGARVLLPVDREEHARCAYELASSLFPDGTFVLLHVVNPADVSVSVDGAMASLPEGWYDQQQAQAETVFDALEQRAREDHIETERLVELGKPSQQILDTIDSAEIDHVVMSSHRRQGVSRLLLGSTAETVVRCSPVPVTIAP